MYRYEYSYCTKTTHHIRDVGVQTVRYELCRGTRGEGSTLRVPSYRTCRGLLLPTLHSTVGIPLGLASVTDAPTVQYSTVLYCTSTRSERALLGPAAPPDTIISPGQAQASRQSVITHQGPNDRRRRGCGTLTVQYGRVLQIMLRGLLGATPRSRDFIVAYPVSFSLRYLYIRPISRTSVVCSFVRRSSQGDAALYGSLGDRVHYRTKLAMSTCHTAGARYCSKAYESCIGTVLVLYAIVLVLLIAKLIIVLVLYGIADYALWWAGGDSPIS